MLCGRSAVAACQSSPRPNRRCSPCSPRAATKRRSRSPSSIPRCRSGCFPGARRWPFRIRLPATCPSCACRCGQGCCAQRLRMGAAADFYDVKSDLAALFAGTGEPQSFTFEAGSQPALHPGRTARVLRCGQEVGWLGELHPTLVQALDFTYPPILFELDMDAALVVKRSSYEEISRFPQVRRDLAIVVDESITLSTLADRVTLAASSLLRDLRIFDVYRGPGLEKGRKSVALGLIFQDISRTLTDDDVERLMASVVADLRENLNARIRE